MNKVLYAYSKYEKRWCLITNLHSSSISNYRTVLREMGYCTCLKKK